MTNNPEEINKDIPQNMTNKYYIPVYYTLMTLSLYPYFIIRRGLERKKETDLIQFHCVLQANFPYCKTA